MVAIKLPAYYSDFFLRFSVTINKKCLQTHKSQISRKVLNFELIYRRVNLGDVTYLYVMQGYALLM